MKDIFRDLGDAKRILRELKLLRHFRPHENVVTILDIMVHPGSSPDFRYVPKDSVQALVSKGKLEAHTLPTPRIDHNRR